MREVRWLWTAGPWCVAPIKLGSQDLYFTVLPGAAPAKRAPIICQTIVREKASEQSRLVEDEANARLIAAAPELYEALNAAQRILADLSSGDPQTSSAHLWAQCVAAEAKARAALAKARGEQPEPARMVGADRVQP